MRLLEIIRDFLFGAFYLDLYRETSEIYRKTLLATEVLVFGDLIGIPLLTSYYSLRLLPYFLKDLYDFRRETLKERDVLEELSHIDVH
ncbi:MAG: hypothetical protein TU35_004820 [Thermoproteus sp. AZ2]|jgi:hypothetical protein|uniref:Uncharacterized protein n=1 Tax=Thermoproteus sp. AZ2 TaxID=1609232 RepID=A0ACC6V136_9CREN|nr:MAG: hypothetical protein TU35_07435 [Thermoproteus sp. AZ2]